MSSSYFLLHKPYVGDFNDRYFVNGMCHRPISVGFVICPRCNGPFGNGRRLSFRCPKLVRIALKSLPRPREGAIPWEEFLQFRLAAERVLRRKGHSVQLQAGDNFLPCVWNVPSRPRNDFFWPLSHLVSQRVKAIFEERCVRGVTFHPVRLRRVGALEPWDGLPLVDLADPVDLFKRAPMLEDPRVAGTFFELVPQFDAPEILRRKVEPCTFCGEVQDVNLRAEMREYRRPDPNPSAYRPDVDIFFWNNGTLIVSQRTAELIREYNFAGCELTPLGS